MTKKILAMVVVLMLAAFVLVGCGSSNDEDRVYALGSHTVTLYADGTFEARLFHGFSVDGTYTESTVAGVLTVTFAHDGIEVRGTIVDDVLTIPQEWDDGHGHGTRFTLR